VPNKYIILTLTIKVKLLQFKHSLKQSTPNNDTDLLNWVYQTWTRRL